MHRMIHLALTLGFTVTLTSCLSETTDSSSGIPIVGIDKNGVTHEKYIKPDSFINEMTEDISMVNDSTLEALKIAKTTSGAELKTVAVGLGVNIKTSIPQIVSLGTSGRLRLFFSKDDNTYIP